MDPEPAVAVLYTISPVAGVTEKGAFEVVEVSAMRGPRNPFALVDAEASTWNLAVAFGELVPTPICANNDVVVSRSVNGM